MTEIKVLSSLVENIEDSGTTKQNYSVKDHRMLSINGEKCTHKPISDRIFLFDWLLCPYLDVAIGGYEVLKEENGLALLDI